MKVNLRASNFYVKMSGAAEKQTSSNGIVKLNSLAELGFMPAPVSASDKLRWSGFKLERFVVSGDVPLAEKFYPSHIVGIALGGKLKNNFPVIGGRCDVSYRQGESLLCPAGLSHTAYEPREMDLSSFTSNRGLSGEPREI